ncbi:hypothetical protein Achl_1717 [Pseudarthrobacter chlorophenolicus A6]|uniref:Uncharacterized protein n=2 Tax=Pseudarthrobacter chlorophenolicus TaxID=85085 RepID=B8H6X9_PSECP|nr:hypothetical protein Achl_1717 [Pseudarthrobacter chlorophenolicus A6]SDQ95127.1 hypothetical protein SAMN04489738_3787 [Pseudarthrobacter chlorophenolicus]
MPRLFDPVLSWSLAGAAVFALPSCLMLMLEMHPGTMYPDHLAGAFTVVAAGILLLIRPSSAPGPRKRLPEAHVAAFRYAVRSGVLPLTSLFSDWSGELAHHRFLLKSALRGLPGVTWAVLIMDLYGMLAYTKDVAFFLSCALAAAGFSLAAFSRATIALTNVFALEHHLRHQQQLLDAPHV